MRQRLSAEYSFAGLIMFAICVQTASAQSAISGQVRDSSGAAMAGVRVEAASPVLIEGSRSVTSNGEGRYTIVDVRPGDYTVTFTMDGFATTKLQVDVPRT